MEIVYGGRHHLEQLEEMMREVFKGEEGYIREQCSSENEDIVHHFDVVIGEDVVCRVDGGDFNLCSLSKWWTRTVHIHITREQDLDEIKKIAEEFEEKAKEDEIKVIIHKQYA